MCFALISARRNHAGEQRFPAIVYTDLATLCVRCLWVAFLYLVAGLSKNRERHPAEQSKWYAVPLNAAQVHLDALKTYADDLFRKICITAALRMAHSRPNTLHQRSKPLRPLDLVAIGLMRTFPHEPSRAGLLVYRRGYASPRDRGAQYPQDAGAPIQAE